MRTEFVLHICVWKRSSWVKHLQCRFLELTQYMSQPFLRQDRDVMDSFTKRTMNLVSKHRTSLANIAGNLSSVLSMENYTVIAYNSVLIYNIILLHSQLDHGAVFNRSDGCNFCTCYHGDLLCTQHSCIEATVVHLGPTPLLSCDCPTLYAPVCTMTGRTLPNWCIAK